MDFELTDSQREYRDRARTVAEKQLLPAYRDRERAGRIEPELRLQIGGLRPIPPEVPLPLGRRRPAPPTRGPLTQQIGPPAHNPPPLPARAPPRGPNPCPP